MLPLLFSLIACKSAAPTLVELPALRLPSAPVALSLPRQDFSLPASAQDCQGGTPALLSLNAEGLRFWDQQLPLSDGAWPAGTRALPELQAAVQRFQEQARALDEAGCHPWSGPQPALLLAVDRDLPVEVLLPVLFTLGQAELPLALLVDDTRRVPAPTGGSNQDRVTLGAGLRDDSALTAALAAGPQTVSLTLPRATSAQQIAQDQGLLLSRGVGCVAWSLGDGEAPPARPAGAPLSLPQQDSYAALPIWVPRISSVPKPDSAEIAGVTCPVLVAQLKR